MQFSMPEAVAGKDPPPLVAARMIACERAEYSSNVSMLSFLLMMTFPMNLMAWQVLPLLHTDSVNAMSKFDGVP